METYQTNTTYLKGLPWVMQARYKRRGVLLPARYPLARIDKRREFSQSRWKNLACPRFAKFTYVDRLSPLRMREPLQVGKLTHSVISAHAMGAHGASTVATDTYRQWHAKVRENAPERGFDAEVIERHIAMTETLGGRFRRAEPLDMLGTGLRFRVPLRRPNGRRDSTWDFAGEFDGLVRPPGAPKDTIWVYELKTHGGLLDDYEDKIDFDPQRWGYAWALKELTRARHVGVCYDVFRKSTPTPPAFNVCTRKACKEQRAADTEAHGTLGGWRMSYAMPWGEIPVHGASGCPSCGGVGYVAMSRSVSDTTVAWLDEAHDWLMAHSPKAREQDFSDLRDKAQRYEDGCHRRLWVTVGPERLQAFGSEVYEAATEFAWRERTGRWPTQRSLCRRWGRECDFAALCPDMGSGMDSYKVLGESRRDESWEDGLPF